MTTGEVAKLFEASALPRDKRSIERYCEQGKLDCFKDPDEMRYYITRASAEKLIGHLKELQLRHQQPMTQTAQRSGTTADDTERTDATAAQFETDVKQGITEKPSDKRQGEQEEQLAAMQARIKELENKNFNLEIDKRAKEEVIGIMREQITVDRKEFLTQITKHSHRVGQLETEMRQIKAPDPDTWPTPSDDRSVEDGVAIDAEYSDTNQSPSSSHQDQASIHQSQP
jgi:hypothetical protein